MKISFKPVLFAALSASFFFTSCKKDDATPTPDPVKTYAKVLVAHASPDAPGVDLLLNGTVQNSSALEFPNNTGYLTVETGTYNVKVNASGTTTTVINADLTFNKDMNYSVFAVNTLANIEPLVLTDDLTAPASGKAHFRFIHLCPDAPAVDVVAVIGGTVEDGEIIGGEAATLVADKSFKDYTSFTPVDAGTYDLQARLAGSETVALHIPGVVLEAGKIYTIFAKGLLSSEETPLSVGVIVNN